MFKRKKKEIPKKKCGIVTEIGVDEMGTIDYDNTIECAFCDKIIFRGKPFYPLLCRKLDQELLGRYVFRHTDAKSLSAILIAIKAIKDYCEKQTGVLCENCYEDMECQLVESWNEELDRSLQNLQLEKDGWVDGIKPVACPKCYSINVDVAYRGMEEQKMQQKPLKCLSCGYDYDGE